MKMQRNIIFIFFTTVFLCLLPVLSTATALAGAAYSPKAGVLCDKKAGFCSDSEGISMALTKLYLGEQAEQKMMAEIHKVGLDDFDATTFVLSDGVACNCKAKQCTVSKYDAKVDAAHTQALFGSAPASGAAAAPVKGAVFYPDAGILCDKSVGICADSQGISMAFTQQYLGEAAQQKQMALMKKGGYNEKYFILSDGVACNIADKKCYVGEFDSTVDAVHTTALFGD
jgi:Fels-1 Prophage Protein-like